MNGQLLEKKNAREKPDFSDLICSAGQKARNLRLTAYNQYVLLNMHALLPLSLTLHYPAIPG